MKEERQKQAETVSNNGVAEFIEAVFGIDQKIILKILNFTCLFLALVSFIMSYIAYQYNEMLHLKLLLSLAILLVVFSGLIFWYIPKFEELLNESNRSTGDIADPISDRKND
ncbi:uncharacterized protein cubi_03242 [Cryptosporidium ubiquitum]|uniref:Uncharacterized protein n=1 Tax=Cryptosporidium ubiquitum TaxID=857276 RepID=A0A1J4M9P1_9CRYT|nr:uncharacterized protein cubi_03242 [Cryptosporidium ubiquitum]OII70944.1 hypothetical protein cubi_03242 [Cryptosporidium ubiquitum]